MAIFKKRKGPTQESVESHSPYVGLRDLVLHTEPSAMGLDSAGHERIYGVLMETAHPNGTATLVSLADGTTSLYTSTGGGMIGAGSHAHIAQLSKDVIARAEELFDLFEPTAAFPLPTSGRVRFQVLTFAGGFTLDADERELVGGTADASRLFYAANDVLTALRMIDEQSEE